MRHNRWPREPPQSGRRRCRAGRALIMRAAAMPIAPEDAEAGTTQYLSFVCAGEEYGVEILCVQEIKGWEGVTRVPYTPAYSEIPFTPSGASGVRASTR